MGTKKLVRGGLMLAVAVILPQVFHLIGSTQLGRILLPMHFPVFLSGFLLGPFIGFAVGLLAPFLSNLLTGMPTLTPPIMVLMMVELPVYGILAGFLYNRWDWSILRALIVSMIGGRIALALVAPLFFSILEFPMSPWVYLQGALVAGIPGMAIQLVLLPLLFKTDFLRRLEW